MAQHRSQGDQRWQANCETPMTIGKCNATWWGRKSLRRTSAGLRKRRCLLRHRFGSHLGHIVPAPICSHIYIQRYGRYGGFLECFRVSPLVHFDAENSGEMPMSRARPSIGARTRIASRLFARNPRRTLPRLNVCRRTCRRRSSSWPAPSMEAGRLTVRLLARGPYWFMLTVV